MSNNLKTTTGPTAIEVIVCEEIKTAPQVAMTPEVAGMLMRLLLMKDKFSMPVETKEDPHPFLYKVIKSRIEVCFTFTVKDERLLLFLAIVSETPGKAIMYLWYLQYYCLKNKVRELTLEGFCEVFTMGFPSNEVMDKLWDDQKVRRTEEEKKDETLVWGGDNLVDYATAGMSIQFEDVIKERNEKVRQ